MFYSPGQGIASGVADIDLGRQYAVPWSHLDAVAPRALPVEHVVHPEHTLGMPRKASFDER